MSESNEKQINELETNETVDSKAIREENQRKAEKRSKVMYTVIAVAFVIVAAIALIWRFTPKAGEKDLPAVTIDGQEYTAAEVNFYYQNFFSNFVNNNYYFLSFLGFDMYANPREQFISEDAAAMTGAEAGISWHDYILEQTLQQMAGVQAILADAEANGFTYPESVATTLEETLFSMESTAAASGMSMDDYLKTIFGSTMTKEIYAEHVMNALKYEAYVIDTTNSFTYTDADLKAAYEADRKTYDNTAYEYILVNGAPETKTDADGNTIEATEEETAAAMAAAKEIAEEMLTAVNNGADMKALADTNDKAQYVETNVGIYYGTTLTEWVFDETRKTGDTALLESGTSFYVARYLDRYLNEVNTIDVRHILIPVEGGTLSAEDEGYEAEHEQLLADCKAKAEELLNQWKAGEATEESFAALANEHSTDGGSNTNGGLYSAVQPGQMVPEFNDWCFDTARKSGDTGIVYGTNGSYEGYHIMYFVGENDMLWKLTAESTLRDQDLTEWITAFGANAVIEHIASGMELVG